MKTCPGKALAVSHVPKPAKAAALDAQGIGPPAAPAVKPPPPPPPPPRVRRGERSENTGAAVRLVERDETPLPSQPGARKAKASTVVLIERGEVLPRESEESAEVPVHRDKRRADDQLQGTASRQRGEFLPRYGSDQKLVTRGELLPQDAKALETDSETEQEPLALSSQTSSATPWQRRVKKREERESSASRQSCREWLQGYPGTPCLRYPRSWPTSGRRGQLEASQEHDLCFWPEEAIRWCSRLRRCF